MYLAKHVGGWSTTRIGRFYNGRDHSTVCYALKRVAALREDDPEVDGLVSSLAAEIKTAEPKESGRTDTESQTPPTARIFALSDAFLDALADRHAMRVFDRAKGIDANAVKQSRRSQEQAKGVSVGGKSSGAGMFLVEEEVDEKGLHQARCGYGWCRHSSGL